MDLWPFIIESEQPVALLYVTESKGSSPGRKGFAMAVRETGEMQGSIGGGIMERNLVGVALERLKAGIESPSSHRQVHRAGQGDESSGLICSGEQTVAFYIVSPEQAKLLSEKTDGFLILNEHGIEHSEAPRTEDCWSYEEIGQGNTVYIIGGGHVGLALSRTMSQLGFYVEIFDDRTKLNTIQQNQFANKKHLGPLESTLPTIPEGPNTYVVAVTFGVAVDQIVLTHLKEKNFRYFGMMGSQSKLSKLHQEFGALDTISAPIGLAIGSQTPEEIAISIAAEIVAVKNR